MTARDDLLGYILDGQKPALYAEFEGWVRGSRRFRAFATAYRAKIRAKLRNVRDEGGRKDLRAELATAALLLRDERFTLEYEKYAASGQRGPDFSVTFKSHTPFNVEVRRIRSVELDDGDADAATGKLMAVLGDKVGQMPPGAAYGASRPPRASRIRELSTGWGGLRPLCSPSPALYNQPDCHDAHFPPPARPGRPPARHGPPARPPGNYRR